MVPRPTRRMRFDRSTGHTRDRRSPAAPPHGSGSEPSVLCCTDTHRGVFRAADRPIRSPTRTLFDRRGDARPEPPNLSEHSKGSVTGLLSKDIETLNDAFVHVLQTTYYAEKQITEALLKMIGKASSPELKQGLETHLRETENQVRCLEQVFRQHGAEAKEATCPAIDGIIKAGNSMAGDIADKHVLDAALTPAAQMVEQYEMVQFGTLVAWARELGREDCAIILSETLAEEMAADAKLTRLADSRINRSAKQQAA